MATPLTPELEARIEAVARETGRSHAAVLREALAQQIDAIEDFYLLGRAAHGTHAAPYGTEPGVDLGL